MYASVIDRNIQGYRNSPICFNFVNKKSANNAQFLFLRLNINKYIHDFDAVSTSIHQPGSIGTK